MSISNATFGVFWATVPVALLDTGHTSREIVLYISVPGVVNLTLRVVSGLLFCHFCQPGTVVKMASILGAVIMPGECPSHYSLFLNTNTTLTPNENL